MHNLRNTSLALALAGMLPHAQADHTPPQKLATITVSGGRPGSLPTQIPATMEGISGGQVDNSINAFDSVDAPKYLPSLNECSVRGGQCGQQDLLGLPPLQPANGHLRTEV
jgi:hypothetical protein